mmetsp:Transcript_39511/g.63996  ORF Transcript_39511/g.63996 Transcript_39511/m.63996 type:complete len:1252 (+) Transcript_39511:869-4624(+)
MEDTPDANAGSEQLYNELRLRLKRVLRSRDSEKLHSVVRKLMAEAYLRREEAADLSFKELQRALVTVQNDIRRCDDPAKTVLLEMDLAFIKEQLNEKENESTSSDDDTLSRASDELSRIDPNEDVQSNWCLCEMPDRSWKQFIVSLTSDRLVFHDIGKVKQEVDLTGVTVNLSRTPGGALRSLEKENPGRKFFSLEAKFPSLNKAKYLLAVESAEDRDKWVKAFHTATVVDEDPETASERRVKQNTWWGKSLFEGFVYKRSASAGALFGISTSWKRRYCRILFVPSKKIWIFRYYSATSAAYGYYKTDILGVNELEPNETRLPQVLQSFKRKVQALEIIPDSNAPSSITRFGIYEKNKWVDLLRAASEQDQQREEPKRKWVPLTTEHDLGKDEKKSSSSIDNDDDDDDDDVASTKGMEEDISHQELQKKFESIRKPRSPSSSPPAENRRKSSAVNEHMTSRLSINEEHHHQVDYMPREVILTHLQTLEEKQKERTLKQEQAQEEQLRLFRETQQNLTKLLQDMGKQQAQQALLFKQLEQKQQKMDSIIPNEQPVEDDDPVRQSKQLWYMLDEAAESLRALDNQSAITTSKAEALLAEMNKMVIAAQAQDLASSNQGGYDMVFTTCSAGCQALDCLKIESMNDRTTRILAVADSVSRNSDANFTSMACARVVRCVCELAKSCTTVLLAQIKDSVEQAHEDVVSDNANTDSTSLNDQYCESDEFTDCESEFTDCVEIPVSVEGHVGPAAEKAVAPTKEHAVPTAEKATAQTISGIISDSKPVCLIDRLSEHIEAETLSRPQTSKSQAQVEEQKQDLFEDVHVPRRTARLSVELQPANNSKKTSTSGWIYKREFAEREWTRKYAMFDDQAKILLTGKSPSTHDLTCFIPLRSAAVERLGKPSRDASIVGVDEAQRDRLFEISITTGSGQWISFLLDTEKQLSAWETKLQKWCMARAMVTGHTDYGQNGHRIRKNSTRKEVVDKGLASGLLRFAAGKRRRSSTYLKAAVENITKPETCEEHKESPRTESSEESFSTASPDNEEEQEASIKTTPAPPTKNTTTTKATEKTPPGTNNNIEVPARKWAPVARVDHWGSSPEKKQHSQGVKSVEPVLKALLTGCEWYIVNSKQLTLDPIWLQLDEDLQTLRGSPLKNGGKEIKIEIERVSKVIRGVPSATLIACAVESTREYVPPKTPGSCPSFENLDTAIAHDTFECSIALQLGGNARFHDDKLEFLAVDECTCSRFTNGLRHLRKMI